MKHRLLTECKHDFWSSVDRTFVIHERKQCATVAQTHTDTHRHTAGETQRSWVEIQEINKQEQKNSLIPERKQYIHAKGTKSWLAFKAQSLIYSIKTWVVVDLAGETHLCACVSTQHWPRIWCVVRSFALWACIRNPKSHCVCDLTRSSVSLRSLKKSIFNNVILSSNTSQPNMCYYIKMRNNRCMHVR